MSIYLKIYKHQNNSCFYCKLKIDFTLLEKEHVYPKSKGGRGINNKVLACNYCNRLKENLTINEFKLKIQNLLLNPNPKKSKLKNILYTLNNIQEIRPNFHKNTHYKSNNLNEIPLKSCKSKINIL